MRYIASVISAVLLCSSIHTAVLSAEPRAGASVQDEAESLLSAIGMAGTNTNAYELTRAQFAEMLSGVYRDNADYSQTQYFVDVPAGYKYASVINLLTAHGVISDINQKRLYPESPISYNEASAWLCRMLGFGAIYESRGYSDKEYYALAGTEGLFKNVKVDNASSAITRDNAVIMLFNAIQSDVIEVDLSSVNVSYTRNKNNLLYSVFDIQKMKGVVEAMGDVRLDGNLTVGKNTVIIDGISLSVDDSIKNKCTELAGYNVNAYYDYKEDVLVSLSDSNKSTTITIDAKDIIEFESDSVSYYNASGAKKTTRFLKTSHIILNGRPCAGLTNNELDFDVGSVTLIASDGGDYDTVIIKKYDTIVVKSIIPSAYSIYDKYGALDIKDLDYNEDYVIYDTDGRDIGFAGVQNGMVLSVAASKEKYPHYEMIASSKLVNGSLQSISTDDDGVYFDIDGKLYPVVQSYYGYCIANNSLPQLGTKGDFLLDAFGNIAGLSNQNNEGFTCGVLRKCYYDDDKEKYTAQIFTETGAFVKYDLSTGKNDTIKLNNSNAYAAELTASGDPYVIRYKLNRENEITAIEKADNLNNGKTDGLRTLYDATQSVEYRKSEYSFEGKVSISSNAKVFIIPIGQNAGNEDYYFIKNADYFSNGTTYSRQLQVYATRGDQLAGDIVAYHLESAGTISNSSNMGVLMDVYGGLDRDGNATNIFTVLRDGKEYTLTAAEGTDLNNTYYLMNNSGNSYTDSESHRVERGDLIRYASNGLGEVTKIELVYDASEHLFMGVNGSTRQDYLGTYTNYFRMSSGNVLYMNEGFIKVQVGSNIEYHMPSKFNITYVDMENGKKGEIRAGTEADILSEDMSPERYSYVVMRLKNGDPSSMIVYNYTR